MNQICLFYDYCMTLCIKLLLQYYKRGIPIILCLAFFCSCSRTDIIECDICIYGGTSSGVIAACAADRLGKNILLIEPEKHTGGLSSGGLGATDIGNKFAITGMARDFYRQIGQHYGEFEKWTFEPHVAEHVFNSMISESKVKQLKEFRILSVSKEGERVKEIVTESNGNAFFSLRKCIRAKVFIDCSYEGDLMAKCGISYTIGRESNSVYGETLNGVELRDKHQFPDSIDPFVEEGNPKSGLLWGICPDTLKANGYGDKKVQAYNFRLCITENKHNFLEIKKPSDYDPSHYELLRRLIRKHEKSGKVLNLGDYMHIQEMPNGKTDINNKGAFSTDFINMSWHYPEASYSQRGKIIESHVNYIKGFLYFLGHDKNVPLELRNQMLQWGYAKDEFTDNGGFPYQMYIRESRRMIGEYVMTEKNCTGELQTSDGIGMAAYTMDSHNCERIVYRGMVKNEGDVQAGGFPPYDISYFALTPKRNECTNVLVPVCLSSSHIAYGSIRMEPVFMVLGESAALAASSAIDNRCAVQEVNVHDLQKRLSADPLLNGSKPVSNSDK
jgi:FAD dependent oxidoreductase